VGFEDLESRNPETITTVGETVARDSRLAVKLIYRGTIYQVPHEDFGNREICAKFVLRSRIFIYFAIIVNRFPANRGVVIIHPTHSPQLAPADISII
jgi:hypothetical protein